MIAKKVYIAAAFAVLSYTSNAQKGNDVNTPLHLLKPDYPVPYGAPTVDNVKQVLDKVYNYLNNATPTQFVNRRSGDVVSDLSTVDTNTMFKAGDFRLTSYEWGVTYSG